MQLLHPFTFRIAGCRTLAGSALLALTAGLAGCAVGSDYHAPALAAPAAWSAPLPHAGSDETMQAWWRQFADPTLSELIQRAETDSPSLLLAWANIEKSRATLAGTQASAWPSLDANASAAHARELQSGPRPTTSTTRAAGLDASWEVDLFGKLRRQTEAARARVDARTADWHDARISLAAEVADSYVQYRGCGLLADTYRLELDSVMQTERATAVAVQAGFNAPADGALARASVAGTRSTLVLQRAQCDLLVKSLVELTGLEEPALRQLLAGGSPRVPEPRAIEVRSVPADVVRQRPDLSSLERGLAASSADIGATQADLYPSLSLSGSINVSAASGTSALTTWSFGPTLSIPLFDGGRRRAAVRNSEADYTAAIAGYRRGVRRAIREVEQALVNLDSAARRAEDAALSAAEYRRYFESTESNWHAGNDSLLTLEEARRSALSAQVSLLTLQQNRVQDWIALYKALGGGWQTGAAASPPLATNDPVQKGSP